MAPEKFKAIIIGGGPAGLTAAHILYKAGIDFVVLEARDKVVVDHGAAMVLGPQNLRVIRQLGLYDKLLEIGAELLSVKGFLQDGRVFKDVPELETFKENHGIGLVAFHRAQLVQFFYDNFPDETKARYLTNKRVTSIESGEEGVKVTAADGSVFEGSIVIGADGVHSVARKIVRELALAEDPKRDWDPENPFPAEYRCLWFSFPPPTEPDTVYDDKDVEDFVAKVAEYPVTETLKVKDLFEKRQTAGLSDLGEGIAMHWSWGRIVLVGDAIHKFTPNAGLGLNNAIQDIVALTNGLHTAIKAAPGGQADNQTLSGVFRTYREQRVEGLQQDYDRSALVTRLQAWRSRLHFFLSRFVFSWPFISRFVVNRVVSPVVRRGLVLSYVPSTDLPKGRISWEHQIPAAKVV
ncbi:hypothetical protein SAPIO_CDS4948 [Scedosporium apiospermum]|uniref:FAD-binding domain-containing protein n=1 Tax=Pseudallescheria apiosperma TaxID=563466 RepID=A0A084G7E0_PSEDA|nr:uncharacterized protein SAPIO_CDS4948 [Scedosporium apiospermum]KEZ43252.1 hypothetical protein SAPIO_CDS4948 [Scedosporium apiospermum]